MAGGVGEGAIPLSLGYAQLGGGSAGQRLAEILPAVMFGSLVAVLIGGALNRLGTRFPDLTGHGALEPDGPAPHPVSGPPPAHPSAEHCGAALVLALTLYLLGLLSQRAWHWPAPVVMLLLAVAVKLGGVAPPWLERGAQANYRFFAACVTYPLLFAIGVAKTPWQTLAAAFNAPTMLTIVATVTALVGTGFYTARWFRMAPIECALINACHSGQGGTGDVAILTAAGRLQLMPFAQIATRLGGALTVSLALLAFAAWKA
jgi:Na+/citrate or Na+/malate symporter